MYGMYEYYNFGELYRRMQNALYTEIDAIYADWDAAKKEWRSLAGAVRLLEFEGYVRFFFDTDFPWMADALPAARQKLAEAELYQRLVSFTFGSLPAAQENSVSKTK
jgi:hypothetical protein